jgi:hypothetical protein
MYPYISQSAFSRMTLILYVGAAAAAAVAAATGMQAAEATHNIKQLCPRPHSNSSYSNLFHLLNDTHCSFLFFFLPPPPSPPPSPPLPSSHSEMYEVGSSGRSIRYYSISGVGVIFCANKVSQMGLTEAATATERAAARKVSWRRSGGTDAE